MKRSQLYGLSTKRARQRIKAHIAQVESRVEAIRAAVTAEEEDPFIETMTDRFLADVGRWKTELEELMQYYEEDVV